jgi:hypothetical protein
VPIVLESEIGRAVLIALDDAAPLACAATMATTVVAYVLCSISARRMGAHFSLGRLEKVELDRGVLLYEKVFDRLHDIRREADAPQPSLLARYRHRRQVRGKFASELRDLQTYAAHLRATIITLRRRPLGRFRSWLHLDSSRFALGRSLAAWLLVLAVLTACSHGLEQLVMLDQSNADDAGAVLAGLLLWQGAPERMIDINLIGACFLPLAAPLFYFYRRVQLRMEHARQFRRLKTFALADPDRLIRRRPTDPVASDSAASETAASEQPVDPPPTAPADIPDESPCFSVLGVSPSATIEEIKQAYKAQVRQNHPDRVHDMSPAFRELAEARTKKLNAAYQEALMSLQHV